MVRVAACPIRRWRVRGAGACPVRLVASHRAAAAGGEVTEQQAADLDALRTLLASHGWALFRRMVLVEIEEEFQEHITKALDVPDGTVALDRMRQIAAVRQAGARWLARPAKEVNLLQQMQRASSPDEPQSRRGAGL